MAKVDRCPICGVSVRAENLLRHLNDIHPRHPDTPALREQLREEPGRIARRKAGSPVRVRRWHVAVVALIVVGGVGAYYAAGILLSPPPFPCLAGENVGLVYHWHADLLIRSGGAPVHLREGIGVGGCLQPIHTHSPSASNGVVQLHIESDTNRLYSLGDFFTIWREPFGSPTGMLVNDTAQPPSASVILYDGTSIVLDYATFTP